MQLTNPRMLRNESYEIGHRLGFQQQDLQSRPSAGDLQNLYRREVANGAVDPSHDGTEGVHLPRVIFRVQPEKWSPPVTLRAFSP